MYRYYTVHSEKKIALGLNAGLNFQEKVGKHGFAHNGQGWVLAIDLNRIEVGESWLDVWFAYRIPYSSGYRIPYSAFEVNLGYYLVKAVP